MFQLSGLISSVQLDFDTLYHRVLNLRSFVENNYIIERALRGDYINTLRHNHLSNDKNYTDTSDQEKVHSGPIVSVNEGEFSWTKDKAVLKDINFEANPGDLVAVVGKTGSGKSSLLISICGEVEMTKGTGSVVGSIALVEQTPWIMNGSLRENILFGREYDQEFYNKVIFSCALSDDISNWKNGDQTVIGERGINISGGQKARLALARAVYSRAEIYVLDDPLSAVDAHVKRHVLDHVIMDSGLLAGTIRIMATHEEKLLPYFGKILQLDSKGSDLEYALKEINLTIKPGEKVGIVGRTGAGKTSLARCLFRLVGNSTCSGSILIDGHNIQSMNIGDVRAKLGSIPQEPTLFNGTFRQNLDPLVKYTVEDMWSAIVKCGIVGLVQPKLGHGDDSGGGEIIVDKDDSDDELLKEIERWNQKWSESGWMMRTFLYLFVKKPTLDDRRVPSIRPHGLDRYAKDTFSNGQKQLVGLCRLLMRNRKIIVLDEATANVDPESNQNMHRLIHSEFKSCTVLTIAHRLETIMNSDRIIVMDSGRVAEIGRPEELLEKKGYFAELVKANDFGE
ncbi:hypothetical protein EV179_004482 [Coemansia sp. RSA 487]|nr:hypothetical protein EV179_004482 [Coemansia sp. RSA 487]